MSVYAVIMAGGRGTRFWPVSRQSIPKQCLHIAGHKSMIQETVDRLIPIIERDKFYVATGNHLYEPIKQDLPDIGFILEPVARNTAPCIGLSMIHLLHKDPDAIVLLETADHYYQNEDLYRQHLLKAIDYATTHNNICLIGIKPSHPATGYGYIQQGNPVNDQGIRIFEVQRFVEKPEIDVAEQYVDSGKYLWNSGMFIARAQVMLDEIALYMPHLYAGLMRIQSALKKADEKDKEVDIVTEEVFESLPSEEAISIDFGVMERSKNVVVVEGVFPWDDVGSWASMDKIIPKDDNENVVNGAEYTGIESSRNIIYSTSKRSKRLITLLGVHDMVIVDTDDAIMICPKEKTEDVKKIVDKLKQQEMQGYL
ncbi:mannose-1-phosphate guanylyltransferase [Candidatus Desantisbacteria bacterium]|nr:mannose-1-phosphate guanylyltransferase [Candidatus Desantisbacteria bacterium]